MALPISPNDARIFVNLRQGAVRRHEDAGRLPLGGSAEIAIGAGDISVRRAGFSPPDAETC